MSNVVEIQLNRGLIIPCPYQPRKKIDNLQSLADSIADVGLIEPIVVRKRKDAAGYELIAGERRWRASVLAKCETVTAILRDVTDSQARRIAFAENVQRDDLTRVEEIDAWVKHLDAELWQDEEYRTLAQENNWPAEFDEEQARLRARWLLMKLDSDARTGTDYFSNKFIRKIEAVFSTHPRKVAWQSFLKNDIPLLDLPPLVLDIAIESNLNKSQTKAVGKLAEEAERGSREAREAIETRTVTVESKPGHYEEVPLAEASSREIANAPSAKKRKLELDKAVGLRFEETKPVRTDLPEGIFVYHGDFIEVQKRLKPESFDYVITDPPYPREYLYLYPELSKLSCRLLKPGGSLLVLCGQSYLPDVINGLTTAMTYHWTVAYLTPGGQAPQIWQRRVNSFWKPVLWLVKGEYSQHWIGDVSKSKVNDNDKRYHYWGQSESGMLDLIERFTKPGDSILDPMCGGGSTGVAAVMLKRKFTGIDIDEEAVKNTRFRISNVKS